MFLRGVLAIAVLVFAAVGSAAILSDLPPGPFFSQPDPLASTDQALNALDLPHPAVTVEEVFQPWRKEASFLFVAPARDPASLQMYYLMIGLAYPRQVGAVLCSEGLHATHQEIPKIATGRPLDGLIFFETSAVPGASRIGSKLSISPHTGVSSWQSFCP